MPGFDRLLSEVVKAGLCTNCGTCAAVCPRQSIVMEYATEEPRLAGDCGDKCGLCVEVCPGKDIDFPMLCRSAFGRGPNERETQLGVTRRMYKGYAAQPDIRGGGTGGGIVSSLLAYALEKDLIDAAVVTGMRTDQPWRVTPLIATTRADLIANARSKYASSPANEILPRATAGGRRVGIVGLPCQIHGLRKLQAAGHAKKIATAVQFGIGLFCGSNSPHIGTEHTIVETCNVSLDEVAKVEFRGGAYPGRFQVTLKDGRFIAPPPLSMMMHGAAFYRDRCLMCRDYPNELADVAVGDYYHPDMKPGSLGWSVAIVRSEKGEDLVEGARKAGYLYAEDVAEGYMMGAGYEMKNHGAVYRLLQRKAHGWPVPDYHMPLSIPIPSSRAAEITPPYAKS